MNSGPTVGEKLPGTVRAGADAPEIVTSREPASHPMTLVVVLEQRFARTQDGTVWAPGPFRSSIWPRYLEVFDRLRVLARVNDVAAVPADWEPAACPGVSFAAVPNYLGPWQYLRRFRSVGAAIREAVSPQDAVILRVPSQLGSVLAPVLARRAHPFAVEVIGDPHDVFAPGSVRHVLRPFLRRLFVRRLRRECRQALAALYVTERALQRRYPCPRVSVGVSDVTLLDEHFCTEARRPGAAPPAFTLVMVGTLAQLYKAPDVLIDALAACVAAQLSVRLTFVGDGEYRPVLEAQARRLGVADRVTFLGHLSRPADVRAVLDRADLFVLPSHQEGLPRALLEAMARALPCVGSTVGGFPELLAGEDLVPPGDATALARKIAEVLGDADRLRAMSARNLARARDFREGILRDRRVGFLAHVRDQSATALSRRRPSAGGTTPSPRTAS